ncbi:hypothetical protein ERJ75_001167000 [Trypanosoma vivax]|nr:hypothetical protein ERJ75_001167000 [Trypanosoma vivax]
MMKAATLFDGLREQVLPRSSAREAHGYVVTVVVGASAESGARAAYRSTLRRTRRAIVTRASRVAAQGERRRPPCGFCPGWPRFRRPAELRDAKRLNSGRERHRTSQSLTGTKAIAQAATGKPTRKHHGPGGNIRAVVPTGRSVKKEVVMSATSAFSVRSSSGERPLRQSAGGWPAGGNAAFCRHETLEGETAGTPWHTAPVWARKKRVWQLFGGVTGRA